jgi:hypothetical protein
MRQPDLAAGSPERANRAKREMTKMPVNARLLIVLTTRRQVIGGERARCDDAPASVKIFFAREEVGVRKPYASTVES